MKHSMDMAVKFLTAGVGLILGLSNAVANPTGGKVVSGSAGIAGEGTGAVTVSQASNLAIINWQTFSINSGESTTFLQPSATSAALNRILGGQTSLINGSLTANGSIYLINGNGIVVGPGGVITANAFTASTRDISNSDFLNGNLQFTGSNNAGVQNFGTINALGGNVVLIGKTVDNEGTINARKGTAGLVAADSVLLAQKNADGSTITVNPDPLATSALSQVGVKNGGTISAAAAELKAANGNVYALAIQNSGTIRATTARHQGGHIWLTSDSGSIVNSGTLAASATVAKGQGGSIVVKSTSGSVSDTGAIVAQGGQGGVGGNVDLSGLTLQFSGTVNLTASGGTLGNLLLDPTDLDIVTGGGSSLTGSTVDPSAIVAALNLANVTLQADNSITVTNAINAGGNTNAGNLILDTLTLNLNAGITLKSGSTLSGTATTVNVGAGGLVQNGVDAAASGATVNLAATTYDLTGEIVIDKNLTLNGSTTGSSILNGQGDTRVMEIDGTATGDTINLTGLTLENGNGVDTTGVGAAGSSYANAGGGLLIYTAAGSTANVTISRSSVLNNAVVGSYGASFNSGGNSYGGGIDSAGSATVTINTSTISGNSATGGFAVDNLGGAGVGGGIENSSSGTITINSSTISGNSATGGGAGFYGDNGYGGGIDNSGSGTVRINTSTLSGNSAVSGSGFYNGGISSGGAINNDSSGTVVISNSTLSGNSAAGGGTTFYNPIAGGGGAIANSGKLTISDTILAGNTVGGAESDYYDNSGDSSGIVSDNGYNLFGTGGGYTGSATGDINYAGLITSVLDTTLANNGGPTETLALVNGSVAIGAGGANIGELELDQRGLARPETNISIGAYEYNERGNPFIITSIHDNAVSGITYLGQLRTALAYANANPFFDPTITFDAGVFTGGSVNVITLSQGELLINSSLTIDASAVDGVTLNANNASRVMEIDGTATGDMIGLNNLTLTGGNGIDTASAGAAGSTHANEGGGLLIYSPNGKSATVSITSSTFSNNSASVPYTPALNQGGNAAGGGIEDASAGSLLISQSTISGNSVVGGEANANSASVGGMATGGGLDNGSTGSITIVNSTFSGNSATGGVGSGTSGSGFGGAISNGSSGSIILVNSTLSGNSANGGSVIRAPGAALGGGIYNAGSLTIGDIILAGNTAGGESDYYSSGGTLTDAGYNLYGQSGNAGGFTGTGTGDILLTGLIDTVLDPLANNGGPTETMALVVGSAALGSGGPTFTISDYTLPTTDQRGDPRTTNGVLDIGAYQDQGTSVTGTFSLSDGTLTYGTSGAVTITFTLTSAAGTIAAGSLPTVTLDDQTETLTLDANGTYQAVFDTPVTAGATTYDVTANFNAYGHYAAESSNTLSFTINPATLTIAASAGETKTYGQDETGVSYPNPSYTVTGLVNGDSYGGVAVNSDGYAATAGAGSYSVGTSGGSGTLNASSGGTFAADYTVVYAPATANALTVGAATLTITASAGETKTYGQDATGVSYPNPSYTVTGLANGDSYSGVALNSDGYAATTGAGSYSVSTSGGSGTLNASSSGTFATDYNVVYAPATANALTVNAATLTITASTGEIKTYGQDVTGVSYPNPSYTVTGLANGDSYSGVVVNSDGYAATAGAGSYSVGTSGGTGTLNASSGGTFATDYNVVYSPATSNALTVNAATLTITASTGETKTYGQDATGVSYPNPSYTVTGLANGDSYSGVALNSDGYAATAGAGSYSVGTSGGSGTLNAGSGGTFASDYTVVYAPATANALTVGAATLTITANTGETKTYGQDVTGVAYPNPSYTVTGLANGDSYSGVALNSDGYAATTGAGSYSVSTSGGSGTLNASSGGTFASDYTVVYAPATANALTVNPATLTITASTGETKTYGQDVTGVAYPNPSYTVTGLANGDSYSGVALNSDGYAATAGAGSYSVGTSGGSGTLNAGSGGTFAADYTVVYAPATANALTVNAATLTITASTGETKTYGQDATGVSYPNPSYTVTGLANGDSYSGVAVNSDGYVATAGAGSYSVSTSGGSGTLNAGSGGTFATDYNVVYAPATANALTVNAATLTITASTGETKTYGQDVTGVSYPNPSYTVTGLANGDSYSGVALNSDGYAATAGAGSYSVGTSGGSGTLNAGSGGTFATDYNVVYAPATANALTVNAATLTITASTGETKTYGQDVTGVSYPNPSYTVTGLANGDSYSGVALNSDGYAATAGAGSYSVGTSGGSGTLNASSGGTFATDYTVVYATTASALTVNAATLTITAATGETKIYGQDATETSYPNPSYTVTGLVNGDSYGGVTLNSDGYATTADVGSYSVTTSGGTGTLNAGSGGTFATDYAVVYAPATAHALTVNPAILTYVANPVSIYLGQTIPPLTGTVTGFVNDQTIADATTGTLTFTTTAKAASMPGSYDVTGSGLTADNGNYVFVQAPGNATAFTIKGYQFGLPGNPFAEFSAQFNANANYNTFFTQSWFPLFDPDQDGWLIPVFSPGNVPHPVYSNRQPGYGGKEKKPKHTIEFGSSYQILGQTGAY